MARIEVDEAEWEARNRVLGFVNKAFANPATRVKVLEVQKALDPNFTAPELESKAYVDDRLSAIEKLIRDDQEARQKHEAERDAAQQKAELERRWTQGRTTARSAGYTDEGMGKLEEFMSQNGIMDHSIAMPAFERENPLPKPVETGDNRWGFFDQQTTESPDLKPLMDGNDEQFLRTQIASTLNEIRGGR